MKKEKVIIIKNYLSQKDVLKQTGLKFYQLEHLIRSGIITVYQFGKGNPRLFPPEAVEIIKARLAKLNIE